ncbi:MAG: rhomboid family intramembrane serine protease [Vicinamibacteria bacterium]
MLIPLTHEQMTVQRLPWITILIMIANVYVFLVTNPQAQREEERLYGVIEELHDFAARNPGIAEEHFSNEESLAEYQTLVARLQEVNQDRLFGRHGFVPSHQEWVDGLSSLFLHGGWMHLLGNMYLLWLCGCCIEDIWGRPVYAVLYATSGLAACLAHAAAFPDSQAPLVGASGAIAGLMGAFLVRLHATRIRFFYMYWIHWGTFYAPAWVMLPLWLSSQFIYAFMHDEASPVAFWAHVGGFLFGAVAALFIKLTLAEEAFLAPSIEQKTTLFAQSPQVSSALHHIEDGRYQEALRSLQGALGHNPDDVDALDLAAQAHLALGSERAAAETYARKVRSHLKRRERDLALDAYAELQATGQHVALAARDLLALAPALVEAGHSGEAEAAYWRVIDSADDDAIKLRACMALVDLYVSDGQGKRALEVLAAAAPLADGLPEWKPRLREKTEAAKTLVPATMRPV